MEGPRAKPLGIIRDLWTSVQVRVFPPVLNMAIKNYKNIQASLCLSSRVHLWQQSPKPGPLAKVQLRTLATLRVQRHWPGVHNSWNALCEACTGAGGEVQLYGDTHSVTVKFSGAQRRQVTRPSANLSHLVQPIQFRGIEGAEAPVATVDPVTVTSTVAGLHWANVVCRFIEFLFSYVSKM